MVIQMTFNHSNIGSNPVNPIVKINIHMGLIE